MLLQTWTNSNSFNNPVGAYEYSTEHNPSVQEQAINYFNLPPKGHIQEPHTVKKEKEISGTESYSIPTIEEILPYFKERQYTQTYMTMRLNSVLGDISKNLDDWSTNGIENSVVAVYNIKKILEENSHYFDQSSKTRLLSAALELIFENNTWDNIPLNQVRHLSFLVKNLQEKDVDVKDIFSFLKSLKQTKIRIMKPYHEEKEEA